MNARNEAIRKASEMRENGHSWGDIRKHLIATNPEGMRKKIKRGRGKFLSMHALQVATNRVENGVVVSKAPKRKKRVDLRPEVPTAPYVGPEPVPAAEVAHVGTPLVDYQIHAGMLWFILAVVVLNLVVTLAKTQGVI